jgi:hypothetical protein
MMPMKWLLSVLAGISLPLTVSANPWQFSAPIPVSVVHGDQLFQHLESSGRHNIAVSGDTVAVAWEDDRDGTPRIYLARKKISAPAFGTEIRLSGKGDAFEPSLVAIGDGRFVVAWEEEGQIHMRTLLPDALGETQRLQAESVQASLWSGMGEVLLVDAERQGRFSRIIFHRFSVDADGNLGEQDSCPVDAEAPKDDQLYPSVAQQSDKITVAWEDRRPGHTIIMASESVNGAGCRFTPPQRISMRPVHNDKNKDKKQMPYGRGYGVSRVALASFGKSGTLAAWADKRDFREGYDIYSAIAEGSKGFGVNERVQDDFGGVAQQWHTTVAGAEDGTLVVAWDDNRDGDANIMMSWRDTDAWSEDVVLPGAGGAGEQGHPTITLDRQGNLHAAWVERATRDGATRLFYCLGSRR